MLLADDYVKLAGRIEELSDNINGLTDESILSCVIAKKDTVAAKLRAMAQNPNDNEHGRYYRTLRFVV